MGLGGRGVDRALGFGCLGGFMGLTVWGSLRVSWKQYNLSPFTVV